MAKTKKPAKFEPDPNVPVQAFEDEKWRKDVGGMFLQFGRSVRTGEMRAVEILAQMQVFVNSLSERLDMVAMEDAQALQTMVFPKVRVRVNDPAYG